MSSMSNFLQKSGKTSPTENDYCSLLYVQFHHNSTFRDEIFCGHSIDVVCNSGENRASKAFIIRGLHAKQNRPKNYVQYCICHFSDGSEVVIFIFRLFKVTNIEMVLSTVNIRILETSSKNVQRKLK
jgi:hypothetical protein